MVEKEVIWGWKIVGVGMCAGWRWRFHKEGPAWQGKTVDCGFSRAKTWPVRGTSRGALATFSVNWLRA